MGSIQGLRSEALAIRAREDTNLQVSGHLGTVNKSLGSQLTQMLDGLQGVIGERTKAYNGLVTKLNQSINGKGGIGDQAVQWAFSAVKTMVTSVQSIIAGVSCLIAATVATAEAVINGVIGAVYAVQFAISALTPPYTPDLEKLNSSTEAFKTAGIKAAAAASAIAGASSTIGDFVKAVTDLIAMILKAEVIQYSIKSAIYDYEKMASQLGLTAADTNNGTSQIYSNVDPPYVGPGVGDAGTHTLLQKRDSIMPRYKAKDPTTALPYRGYVGTLRRI